MLWLLLTVYLCVGSFIAGQGFEYNVIIGDNNSKWRVIVAILTWPLLFLTTKQ